MPTLAYILHDLDPWFLRFGNSNAGIRWYGLAYVAGFFMAYWLMLKLAQRKIGPIKEDELSDFITMGALLGVMLGGRLGFMLLYDFHGFLRAPWTIFRVWDGGMASHGGIAGLAIFTWFYAVRKGYNWCGVGDNLVCVSPVGIFFGRIANYINGELYGEPDTVRWAVQFPEEMRDEPAVAREVFTRLPNLSLEEIKAQIGTHPQVQEVLRESLTPRHPSQIYQALLEGLLLFAILYGVRWKFPRLPYGILTGLFFILYAIFRMIGEVWRHADSGYIGPFQKGQFYSLFMFAAGGAFLYYGLTRGKVAIAAARD